MNFIRILKSSQRIVVGTHYDPDGDAICSTLAIGRLIVRAIGHRPVLFCASPIPRRYHFLLGNWQFVRRRPIYDLLILIDSAGIARVFEDFARRPERYPFSKIINIDHHQSNDRFGMLQIIDEHASSACEIVYRLYRRLRMPVDRETADILYAGIYAETGGYMYPNTTRTAFRIAADLVGKGVDPGTTAKRLNAKTAAGTMLLSRVLETIRIKQGVGTMVLTQRMLHESRAEMVDSENFVSFLQAIRDVRVSVFLREEREGTRLSLRSDGLLDVDQIAQQFGGGGHRLAAGIRMKTGYRRARCLVQKAILEELRKQL